MSDFQDFVGDVPEPQPVEVKKEKSLEDKLDLSFDLGDVNKNSQERFKRKNIDKDLQSNLLKICKSSDL